MRDIFKLFSAVSVFFSLFYYSVHKSSHDFDYLHLRYEQPEKNICWRFNYVNLSCLMYDSYIY